MNKAKKNIVIVTENFTNAEIRSLSLPCTKKSDDYFDYGKISYIDKLENIRKYQGYLLIISNNHKNENITDLDKKYRKAFNKFERILIYNEKHNWSNKNKWNKLEKVGNVIFDDCSDQMTDEWYEYKKELENSSKKEIRYNKDKAKKLDILYKYLKNYKTRKTEDIVKDLNINKRTIERYMIDLNMLYHNIGYDYSRNEWYFIW